MKQLTNLQIILKSQRWLFSLLAKKTNKSAWGLYDIITRKPENVTIKTKEIIYKWLLELGYITKTDYTMKTLFDYSK